MRGIEDKHIPIADAIPIIRGCFLKSWSTLYTNSINILPNPPIIANIILLFIYPQLINPVIILIIK